MKERVTLTLDRDVLRIVDSRVNGTDIKNRSHAIELFLRQALKGTVPGKAVILAGGKGTRLGHLTQDTPKSLVEVNGKPLLLWNIELCKRHGITDIIVSVGHLKEQIKEFFGDGSKFDVSITYVDEEDPLGTAGPLRLMRDELNETFILMNGDELKDINLQKIYHAHLANHGVATIALTTVDDPSAYGVAIMDGNKVVGFVEKPPKESAPSKLINAGLYVLEPGVIDLIPEGFAMIEHDVFPKLAKEGELYGYPFSGVWLDTGTPERLESAIKDWKGYEK